MPQSEVRAVYTLEKAAHLLCTSIYQLCLVANPHGELVTAKVLGEECITHEQLMMIIEGEVTL